MNADARREVLFTLRALERRHALLTAQSTDGRVSLITSIAGFSPGGDALYFEPGQDVEQNALLLASSPILFTTSHQGAPLRFLVPHLAAAQLAGQPALFGPLPEALERVQRREAYRVPASVLQPPRCTVPVLREDGTPARVDAAVADLSCDGLALYEARTPWLLEEGTRYPGCRLALPHEGEMTVELEVRNLQPVTLPNGAVRRRAGCRFVDLEPGLRTRLGRLVLQLERQQLARRRA